jgi:peroxiredoxin
MNLLNRNFSSVLVVAFLAILASSKLSSATDALTSVPNSVPIGSTLDSFRLTDYQGKEWTQEEFRGKKAIVFAFIGTQCPLAKQYSAKLVELEKQYRDRDVAIVAIDSNVQDSLAEMAAHARKFGFDFAFLKDPAQELANRLGVTRTPEVCVLDAQNQIQYRGRIDDQFGIGYTKEKPTRAELVAALEALLKGEEVKVATSAASGCLIGRGPRDLKETATESAITYADQVSRILQSRCVSCHRPGDIGPMDLSNYEDASSWADMIVEVVSEKRMPPWHASPEHGSFANDRRMPEEEIAIIQQWAANGAVRGDASHEPAPLKFVEGWQLPREPDLVIPMSDKAAEIPARGDVKYQYFVADPKLTEDKWVNGMEIVAGNREVVHHILVFVRDKGANKRGLEGARGFLVGYVPGTRVQMMPEGMAKRIPQNSEFVFQVHYTPNGTATTDLSKVGFIFADPKSITHEIHTTSSVQPELRIPPKEANYKTSAMQPEELPECDLLSLSPHMHVRGKSFRYSAVYADGTREILMDIPKYDFNWQTEYRFQEKKRLPKGTRIFCEAVFDNSPANLNNPDPNSWVHWGDQTYEEMMIGYFHISVPVDPKLGRAPEIKKGKAPQRPTPLQIFETLDTDKDDKLLKSEVPKQLLPTFERLDKNADGILEKSELPK